MTDDDFVRAVLDGSLPPAQFHHRDHLRLTWCLVRQLGAEAATGVISAGIRRYAGQHGQAQRYHETLTRFWVRMIAHLLAARPDITAFDRFVERFPRLLDKNLPFHHWSRETLGSMTARSEWVEPDLLPLPA